MTDSMPVEFTKKVATFGGVAYVLVLCAVALVLL